MSFVNKIRTEWKKLTLERDSKKTMANNSDKKLLRRRVFKTAKPKKNVCYSQNVNLLDSNVQHLFSLQIHLLTKWWVWWVSWWFNKIGCENKISIQTTTIGRGACYDSTTSEFHSTHIKSIIIDGMFIWHISWIRIPSLWNGNSDYPYPKKKKASWKSFCTL